MAKFLSRMESKTGIGFPVPHRFNPLCVKSYKINYPFCQVISFCVASVTSYLVTKRSFHKYLTTPTVLLEERVIETKNTSMYILNCNLPSPLSKAKWRREGIFSTNRFLPWEILLIKKSEIEKTKPTFVMSVLKVEY